MSPIIESVRKSNVISARMKTTSNSSTQRRKRSIFSLVFCLILVSGCHSTRPPETGVGPRFHILTYNVNWGGPRPDLAAEVIRASGADVVCLQETTPEWAQFLRR